MSVRIYTIPSRFYPIPIRSRPIAIRSDPIATRFEFCVKTSSDCSDPYSPLFIRFQTILPFGSDRTRSDPIGPDRADSCPIGPDSHPITADRADWRPIGPIGDFDPPLIGQKDVSCEFFPFSLFLLPFPFLFFQYMRYHVFPCPCPETRSE